MASFTSNSVDWHENDGQQSFTEHHITTTAPYALSVYPADVDGDADVDVRFRAEAAPRRASRKAV